ncbi:MAG: ArsA family ATPase [Candidatus Jordarchaeaceae archaeon]
MTLTDLLVEKKVKFMLFGGKGGVGKTSCAAAAAIWAAEHGKKTLVISTDPAHSLGDSLDQQIGPEIKKIKGVKNLYGLELDPHKAFADYQKTLEQEDSEQSQIQSLIEGMGGLTGTTPPGADEALAFAKVLEYIENPEYDLIIFDTAPSGHTLRLLSLPDVLSGWVMNLLKIREYLSKFTGLFKRLVGKGGKEDRSLETLEKLKNTIDVARKELSDPESTAFVIVMIPEAMAVFETERLLSALNEYEIPCDHIIVNMVYPDIPDCAFCRARRTMQLENLKEIREIYDDFNITEVPLYKGEIRGIERLKELSKIIFGES